MTISRRQLINQCRTIAILSAVYGISVPRQIYGQSDDAAASFWDQRISDMLDSKEADDIVLTALGDMIWTRELTHFDEPEFRNLYRVLQEAEITYGNLEMSLNECPDLQQRLYNYGKDREFSGR